MKALNGTVKKCKDQIPHRGLGTGIGLNQKEEQEKSKAGRVLPFFCEYFR